MPTQNDFLPFATGGSANVMSQAAYAAFAALTNGFGAGLAPSAGFNKVWRQSSIIAAVVAQMIADTTGQAVVDDGTTATIEANLIATIKALANAQINSVAAITTTGGATVLTAAQYGCGFVVISGVLTSNANIIFPAVYGKWTVFNNTTGAYTLTCYCSGGGGVPVAQGRVDSITCDGSNVRYSLTEGVTQAANDNSKALATTEYADRAVSSALGEVYTNSAITLSAGNYALDTSAGPVTWKLPTGLTSNISITLVDARATWGTNPATLDFQGASFKVEGGTPQAGPLVCNVSDQKFTVWWDNTNSIWRLR